MNNAVNTPTDKQNELRTDSGEELGKGEISGDDGIRDEHEDAGTTIPCKTPEMTFASPNAPKLIAVAAIAAPRTADESGLEQENAKAAIKEGARNRM